MADLRRIIIILMAVASVMNVIGVIHCHVNYPYISTWYTYRMGYSIIFPILLALTGFLLIEQLLITDATVSPLNRLRIIYAFGAAIALIIFGISAAIVASRLYSTYPNHSYHHSPIIAAVIAFIDAVVYIAEALNRNRKSGII
ncbi:unnamed protein product [Rotaria sp. Silwood2]|nr:unnamed protein product [Rotaria sp. Silwood2]CAF2630827.1 unnamed protein product [Rotaria sp. Silwood2]CAF2881806.1 unnamed protein product [Rotaria sp. Silwood2]CAF3043938.1 unnamed protein product [Rotaria sp. Silwood2]CAF3987903.1 unnamed protein product [Rotaria sp. Silwood2]